jgi:copper transport protein
MLVLGALIVAALLWPSSPVEAHARLVASDPPSGSALVAPPAAIHLTFSETVDARFSSAELRGAGGGTIGDLPVTPDAGNDRAVFLRILDPAAMTPGTYIVVWRVLSALDGHVTTGILAFSVGTGQAPAIAGGLASEGLPPWWRIGIRWLKIGALLVTVGGWIYGTFVARFGSAGSGADAWMLRRWRRQWLLAASVLAVALLLSLIDQAALVGGEARGAWSRATLQHVLIESRFGTSWLMLAAFLISLLILVQAFPQRRAVWLAGTALSLIALAALPLSGHAAAEERAALAIASDWVHLAAAAAWLGSLAYLGVTTLTWERAHPAEGATALAAMVGRYSRLALVCFAALAVSGSLNAIFHVSGMRSLTTHDYGVTLLVKLGLILTVLIAAALNRWSNLPRLRMAAASGSSDSLRRSVFTLGATVAAELVLGSLLLLAASTLTELPPADGPLPVNVAAKVVSVASEATTGDLRVALTGNVSGAPEDRLMISLSTLDGRPPADVQRVIVRAAFAGTQPGGATLSDRFDAEPAAGTPGSYSFPALRLGVHGLWEIAVTVRRAGMEDQQAMFQVDTSAAAVPPPRAVPDHWVWPRLTPAGWALLALAIVVGVGGAIGLRFIAGLEPLAATLVLVMVALIGAGFTVSAVRQMIPVTASTHMANPVAPEDDSLQRGATLYRAYCLACHGAQGSGVETADPWIGG